MASYNMNQVKVGLKILMDGDPCVIVDADFVKPGKGQAFTKIKYKNFRTARVNEITMKASDSVEGANIVEKEMQGCIKAENHAAGAQFIIELPLRHSGGAMHV